MERYVADLALAQARAGHDVTVVGGHAAHMKAALGADIVFAPAATDPQLVRQLLVRIRHSGPDVVHAHMSAAELAAGLTCPPGTALVTTRHFAAQRGSHPAVGTLLNAVARRFHAQIAVSKYVADHIERDAVVIHPGVDEHTSPPPAHERDHTVLVAQRLEREKDTDVALHAFAASGLREHGWRLAIAGSGSQRPALERLAQKLDIADAVRFLGHRDDVPLLMRRAGLLMAPCGVEGLGLTVVEAMAAALPVVASAAGGHLESVASVTEQTLFPAGDDVAAGRLLAQLAADPDLRDAHGRALQARQRESFSPAAQVRATDEVYAHALAAARPAVHSPGTHDLVVVSLEAWDQVWRRNQHLVAGLLRADPDLRVLFVEPAADPLHAVRLGRLPHRGRGLRRGPYLPGVGPDALWLLQPTKHLPRRVDRGQDRRWAASIARAADELGFIEPTLWVNDPEGAEVLRHTAWPALYDITDDWLEADRDAATHSRLVRHEAALFAGAAEVVVCSPGLVRTKSRQRPVTLLRNAVDAEEQRAPRPRPADLPHGAVAVYVGTLHGDRLDLDLCTAVARGLDGAGSLVLVGPNALTPEQDAHLAAVGVLRLGAKDRRTVPAYLQHADVLIVPHVVDAFTESLDPIKLYEYAAVGRPVVSTPVAGFREAEGPRMTIAEGPDFVAAVRSALPATDSFPNGVHGDVPTWADRVIEMRAVLDRVKGRPLAARGDTWSHVPLRVRVRLGHAAVQHVARLAGVDLLHIKGESLDQSLVHPGRRSTDVDVLVRPEHVDRLLEALVAAGYRAVGRFATSSPFEHSATLRHKHWGLLDVHRTFPGIGLPPHDAFDLLWRERSAAVIADVDCATPDVDTQALILLLHAARSPDDKQAARDVRHVWDDADSARRAKLRDRAQLMEAQVAFGVAVRDVTDAANPEDRLWSLVSHESGRLDEWRARIAASPDLASRARLLARMPLVNTDHLAMLLGRRPTRREVAVEFFARSHQGVRELTNRTERDR